MQVGQAFTFVSMACMLWASALAVVSSNAVRTQEKTITKVVKLLQGMLEKSQSEGDEERKIYAKFKCYCDTSEAEKKTAIEDNTKKISILESKIEELQGSNGQSSSSSANLKYAIADNLAAQKKAETIRAKENKAFKTEKDDLEAAIAQMKSALETLSAVGADQTKSVGADHKQFMAGHKAGASMLELQSTMLSALHAAQTFMNEKQYESVASFMQAPFTGTYTSQSAEVMGILKSMRDTFTANLAAAITTEKEQKKAFDSYIKLKKEEHDELVKLLKKAQDTLGENDVGLAAKRGQLAESQKEKTEDEEFLDKLIPMCNKKAKQYNDRKLLRANEEAAIAEAVSILNSDSAFETFGTVDATSTGSTGKVFFTQLTAVRRHVPEADVRVVMQRLLRRAAAAENHIAPRLNRVISLLHADNPFDTVLTEIEKMIDLIDEEGKADAEKKSWCEKERTENNKELKAAKAEVLRLEGQIDKLDKTINDPETGLKAQITDTEKSLLENDASQKTETADRLEANLAYQKDIKNLVAAEGLLHNAILVLKAYYDQFEKAFLQEDPAPPQTWGEYKGQSKNGGDAISMLKFILSETKKEESEAHSTEEKGQSDYEDSMAQLKKQQAEKEKSLANLQEILAGKEQDLLEAKSDHNATSDNKNSIEDYLEKIKPGCDFITQNFKLREENRGTEKSALEKAATMLKGSPAYKQAEAEATVESYGRCKAPCVKDSADVTCKACMADVTIPGYCAGHPGTKGC